MAQKKQTSKKKTSKPIKVSQPDDRINASDYHGELMQQDNENKLNELPLKKRLEINYAEAEAEYNELKLNTFIDYKAQQILLAKLEGKMAAYKSVIGLL